MTILISLPSTMTPLGSGVSAVGSLPFASPLLSDFIDPQTHDFLSLRISLDPVDMQVLTALKLVRNSGPSIAEDGNNLRDIKKIYTTILNDIASEVKISLNRLIRNGDITYLGLSDTIIDKSNQYVQWMVSWKNLRVINRGIVRSASLTYKAGE
jgi:hypothetical protein